MVRKAQTETTQLEPESLDLLRTQVRDIAEQLAAAGRSHQGNVDAFSLFLQLGLHLPRFQWEDVARADVIATEALRLWERLALAREDTAKSVPREVDKVRLAELIVRPVSEDVARPILERYHYLMSFRPGSTHFGLISTNQEWPLVIVSLSPFDLKSIKQSELKWMKSAIVVSRVYAFPGAPKNAITFTLSKVRHWLSIQQPEVPALITYCNPNLGFTGASYVADNWRLLGYERGTRYTYVQNNYMTDRKIEELFGQPPDVLVRQATGQGISFSVLPLRPLRVFVRLLDGKMKHWRHEPYDFWR